MSKSKITVTIDDELLRRARELNINISSAAEQGIKAEVRRLEEGRLKKIYDEAGREIEK
ncbi:type II toxin-antitoxin system CcdA family antitoxin [Endozoicomonas sp. 4G]|uniref:type II toxin-antitoxin system CcdA family antitoxin n=1 Tax=Endozoicomonas sp. 4G TaxID=2872754 RepID=UPI0020787698|nr:type II toxin-antitoxin system CcdA family antitoxin [Endozoicomonas sp. 4G]